MSDEKNRNSDSEAVKERPKRIGPYRILDTLGEGGMSVVYLAEQSEPVKRRVALKILKPGMDSKQVVARFESERQALAVLDHPNIAKIFDGGVTEFGRPYFVMERVHGVPITDYCDDHRLSTEQRVRLFIEVCSAVQHAHHKGLIHRDLKPSNLLVGVVDGHPMAKVIDFGIAKAATPSLTEQTLFTKIGQIIGTPQYMSPEQADTSGLDVDTRTDIYSLGVVLYELLVGIVPLDLTAIGDHAIRLTLREKDPQKPSTRVAELGDTQDEIAKSRSTDPITLKRQLKGDLDWVVMQAIAKDRTHRYETASALAMECRRYLKREPVTARPPSVGYLLQRFVMRNRLMVTAAAIAIIAVLAGATAATVGLIRATQAERVAVREAETASATTRFLVDLFEVSDPWAFAPVRTTSGADITARQVLELGADRVRNELVDQPEIQSSLMTAIGRVYTGLGLLDQAKVLLQDGLQIRQEQLPPRHRLIADSQEALGRYYFTTGEYESAVNALREAVSIHEENRRDDNSDLTDLLGELSITLAHKGDYEEALERQNHALEKLRSQPDSDPLKLGLALNNLGHVQHALDAMEEAAGTFEEAVSILAGTNARGHYASALANLAALYQVTGRLNESRELHEQSILIKREWFGPEHIETAYSVANLSMLYIDLGRYEDAESLMKEAIAIFSQKLGDDHPNIAVITGNLGRSQYLQGKYIESEATLFEAIDRIRQSLGPEHIHVVYAYNALGELYEKQQKYEEAEKYFRETLSMAAMANPVHSEVGFAKAGIARLPLPSLTLADRDQLFLEAIENLENSVGLGTYRVALAEIDYSVFLAEQGEPSRARELFETGLKHMAASLPADNSQYVDQLARYEKLFGERAPQ